MDEKKTIAKVSRVGILGNVFLVAFKFYAGVVGKSSAMVSDAIHSLSDVLATFIAYLGVTIAHKAPDKDHPYGHDRFECLASLLLGGILMLTGLGIGGSGLLTILNGTYRQLSVPSLIALIAAVVSILSKEAMFWYTRHYAKLLQSSAFMADAWHHRSDALSSIGSLLGIGGAMLGFPIMDPLASVVIAFCILKVGFDIEKDAVSSMTDTSLGGRKEKEIASFIQKQPGVISLDLLHTRRFGSRIYIDAEISVEGEITLREAHEIAERVHDAVEKKFPETKHIMIHENPAKRT